MGQDIKEIPSLFIHKYKLEVVHEYVYLRSIITDNLSINSEFNKQNGKATTKFFKTCKYNNMLTKHNKINVLVYKAREISTLIYGSETWTMHAHQEKRLNVFHMRCLRRILGITGQDMVTNNVVLEKAEIPSLHTLLRQRRMRWLGHVSDGRRPHYNRPFIW